MNISELREQLKQEERECNKWNDWSTVRARIDAALAQVVARDFELLEDGTGERSIAHRLAVYIEEEFPGWHVDCEFNRQGEADYRVTKRVIPGPPLLPESRPGQGTADVTPDIIIHRRRSCRNLVAIEVKPSDSANLGETAKSFGDTRPNHTSITHSRFWSRIATAQLPSTQSSA